MPHIPVLFEEVIRYLQPKKGESYLDLTAGYGGHANAILERTHADNHAVLVDRDQKAIDHLKKQFVGRKVKIIRDSFWSASLKLVGQKAQFDLILADLGVSSPQLQEASRGFSFAEEGPLDMRMDQSQELSALELVQSSSKTELIKLLQYYGEEPRAARIAEAINAAKPINTTAQLATIVAQTAPRRIAGRSRIHPATRTFQALRIAVNDELRQLSESLPLWEQLLAPGGRLAVITFHSLEDRLVKQYFAEHSYGYTATLKLLTKKPVTGSPEEIAINPRARSAKLRAVAKIKS